MRPTNPPQPTQSQRLQLLHGPYKPPTFYLNQTVTCLVRGKAKVCGWGRGPIRWPLIRVGHGGRGAYLVNAELARAIRSESISAIQHWWGVGVMTASNWRRELGVEQFNEGTRHLYSLWKEPKLPDQTVSFSPTALRQVRTKKGLTQRQAATAMKWNSISTYQQLESGRRSRAAPTTLRKLAAVFNCRYIELLV